MALADGVQVLHVAIREKRLELVAAIDEMTDQPYSEGGNRIDRGTAKGWVGGAIVLFRAGAILLNVCSRRQELTCGRGAGQKFEK